MTAPLSQDLRERIVRAVEDGSTIRQAARRFAVSASAAIKLMQRVRQTGSAAPAKIGGYRRPLLEKHADDLRAIVSSKAGITLREIKAALAARGIMVKALSTIADMLHRLGLSHKKKSLRASEQDRPDVAQHRSRWRVWQRYMDGERFVFIDERPWCTDQGCGRYAPYPVLGSYDADGLRASQLQHAVQDLDRHVHLSRPTLVRTRAQPVPDHALEPAHGGLGPVARVVARDLLPAHSALLGDELQVAVPLRRRGLGRGAGHGRRARRHDDVCVRMALGHVGVNALLVVRAVRRDGGERVRDLVEQGADLGGVVFA